MVSLRARRPLPGNSRPEGRASTDRRLDWRPAASALGVALIYNAAIVIGLGVGVAIGLSTRALAAGWGFALGAAVGSGASRLAFRRRARMDPHGPSFCPECRTTLGRFDRLPIVSWLMLGGRCRSCREPIPKRELGAELAVGVVGLLAATTLAAWLGAG